LLNLSHERVRQLESRSLKQLRALPESDLLKDLAH